MNQPIRQGGALSASRTIYACDRIEQLRMRGDRILLKPLAWEPSKLIEVVRHGRPLRGQVMAIGPGHHPTCKRVRQSDGTQRVEYSRHFRPTEVRVGDVVELGGLNIFDGKGYDFTEVLVGNETMLVCTERDVAMVIEQGYSGTVEFTLANLMEPLPPPVHANDPRNVLMRQIEDDVVKAMVIDA